MTITQFIKQLHVEFGEKVWVQGQGELAQQVAHLVRQAGAGQVYRQLEPGVEVDLLVDVSGNLKWVEAALGSVRVGGRVVLGTAESLKTADFDFYPGIHRRSLSFICYPLTV